MLKKCVFMGSAVLMLNACSWVDLSAQGEKVEVMNQDQAAGCERVGQTTSQVVDEVGFLDRSPEKQQEELITLARNEAATMGGNAVVPATQVTEGRQRFIVYRCE